MLSSIALAEQSRIGAMLSAKKVQFGCYPESFQTGNLVAARYFPPRGVRGIRAGAHPCDSTAPLDAPTTCSDEPQLVCQSWLRGLDLIFIYWPAHRACCHVVPVGELASGASAAIRSPTQLIEVRLNAAHNIP